jgi:methionyl-tRNA synthetase
MEPESQDTNPVTETATNEQSPLVAYDEFAKLEIKIGTITAVEVVPDADRLLRLTVDVGEGATRQIISGIREYFADIDCLVGKQCPFLTNLQPRSIRGLESQGMILAGGDGETFTLFHPAHDVPPGTLVR